MFIKGNVFWNSSMNNNISISNINFTQNLASKNGNFAKK